MLRFFDGARHYNTAQLLRRFTSLSADAGTPSVDVSTTGGRDNGPSIAIISGTVSSGGATQSYITKTLDSQATWVVGTRFRSFPFSILSNSSGRNKILSLMDGTTVHLSLRLESSGVLTLYRGDDTLLASSSGQVIFEETLAYIELKSTIADSGTAIVRVNGTQVINFSGDTRNAGNASANIIKWLSPCTTGSLVYGTSYFCDFYAVDAQTGQHTDFLGPQRSDPLFATADGYYTDWTCSTGSSRYALIDENPANDDTDYISALGGGNKFTVKTFTLPHNPQSINGVQLISTMRKDDAGTIDTKGLLRKSSTDYLSASNLTAPDTNYQQIVYLLETDPATSALFTKTDIESNIEFGLSTV